MRPSGLAAEAQRFAKVLPGVLAPWVHHVRHQRTWALLPFEHFLGVREAALVDRLSVVVDASADPGWLTL